MIYGTEREICYDCGSTLRGAPCHCRYNRHRVAEPEGDPEDYPVETSTACECGAWKHPDAATCDDCDSAFGEPTEPA